MNPHTPLTRCFCRILFCLILPAFIVFGGLNANADVPPGQDDQAARTGVEFQPRLGEYRYEITWGNSRVATVSVSVQREGDHYVLKTHQQTTDFIDRVYRVRYRGEAHIKVEDLSPTRSVIEEQIKKRKKVQKAEYDTQTGAVTVEEQHSAKDAPTAQPNAYELNSGGDVVDVFSATFLARSFDWDVGERHEFMVFAGEKQYQVTLDCIVKSSYEFEGETFPVWVIKPGIRKTTKAEPYGIHEKTRIYLVADESKDIVKIESQPGIGTVKLRLIEYTPKSHK